MALGTPAERANFSSGTDGTVYTISSFTPPADSLLLLFVASGHSSAATEPTIGGTQGLTWTKIAGQTTTAGTIRGTLWRAETDGSPPTGTITLTHGTTHASCMGFVDSITGYDTTTPIRQSGTPFQTTTTNNPGITLGTAIASGNLTMGFNAWNRTFVLPVGTGYTQVSGTTSQATPTIICSGEYKMAGATLVDWTTTDDIRKVLFAIEVAAAPDVKAGAATGAVSWSAAATGSRVSAGLAAGAVALAAVATGAVVHSGAATGADAYAGTATGTRASRGASAGGVSWSGAATGARTSTGAATGSLSRVASASGAAVHNGSAGGALAWPGTATGAAPAAGVSTGSASGTWTLAGSATGRRISHAAATGALTWVAVAAGSHASAASVSGALSWAGSAAGVAASTHVPAVAERTRVVPAESRTWAVPAVGRVRVAPADPRTHVVAAENRVRVVPAESRVMQT